MAQKNELHVFISREGKVVIEVDGVRGPSCLDVTKALEETLGRVTEREKKAAFHCFCDLCGRKAVESTQNHAGQTEQAVSLSREEMA